MPQKTTPRRLFTPLLLFTLAGWALWALGRNADPAPTQADETTPADTLRDPEPTSARARERAPWSRRRLATSLAFATLFFGGAAFSAGAGDLVAEAVEGDSTSEVTSTEEAPAEEAPAEDAPAEEAAHEQPADEAPAEEQPADSEAPAHEGGSQEPSGGNGGGADDPGDGGGGSGEGSGDGGGDGADSGQNSDPGSGSGGGAGDGDGSGSGSGDEGSGSGSGDEGSDGEEESPVPPHLDEGGQDPTELPVLDKFTPSSPELDPEADAEGFFATIWLHRTLPDPTPPARRLDGAFASALEREAEAAGVDWAVLLGVLRARGFTGGSMNLVPVRATANRLAELGAREDEWRALLALRGRTSFADRALALTRYNRAVGLRALVTGLQAAKPALQQQVLVDGRLSIYEGGRLDIAMGRTDVRVLVLLRYLAEAHGQVTVSSLTTGHRVFSRPGVVSAHTYGLAVDVAALEGVSILGNQEAGGVTERAVRNILLLPSELQPKQVISLLGLGGPSFPLADHGDHIHVGY